MSRESADLTAVPPHSKSYAANRLRHAFRIAIAIVGAGAVVVGGCSMWRSDSSGLLIAVTTSIAAIQIGLMVRFYGHAVEPLSELEYGLEALADGEPLSLPAPQTLGIWSAMALAADRLHRRLASARSSADVARLDRDQHRQRVSRGHAKLLAELTTSTTCAAAVNELILRSPLTPTQRRYAESARVALETQLRLLASYRNASVLGEGDEPLNPRRCLEQMVEFYNARASAIGCSLLLTFGALPEGNLSIDGPRFRQAMFGLLSHALDVAIGSVRIDAAYRQDDRVQQLGVRIRFTTTADGHRACERALAQGRCASTTAPFVPLPTSIDLPTATRLIGALGGHLELDLGISDGTTTLDLVVPVSGSAIVRSERTREQPANAGDYPRVMRAFDLPRGAVSTSAAVPTSVGSSGAPKPGRESPTVDASTLEFAEPFPTDAQLDVVEEDFDVHVVLAVEAANDAGHSSPQTPVAGHRTG